MAKLEINLKMSGLDELESLADIAKSQAEALKETIAKMSDIKMTVYAEKSPRTTMLVKVKKICKSILQSLLRGGRIRW